MRAGATGQIDALAHVLVVRDEAFEERIHLDAHHGLGRTVRAARIGDAFAHEVLHVDQVFHDPLALGRIVHRFGAQAHARDRRLQVVRDRREDLQAFARVVRDAVLHRVERARPLR